MSKAGLRQILWPAVLSCGLASSAQSGTPEIWATLDLSYALSFWFIPFGHTTYHGIFDGNTYQATSYFKTSGLVSVFWQAEIDAGASGTVATDHISPYIYDSYYRRGSGHKQQVKLTFKPGKPPELFASPPYDIKKYPVSIEEQESGVDPMSAVTLIATGLHADKDNPCGTVAPVFDGRRRYNIEFEYMKDQPLKLDNGLFNGTAHLCRLHYNQIAGFKPKILEEGKAWPPVFALVSDIPDAKAPLGRYVVPLRVWAKTNWGTVTAELTHLKTTGGKPKV